MSFSTDRKPIRKRLFSGAALGISQYVAWREAVEVCLLPLQTIS